MTNCSKCHSLPILIPKTYCQLTTNRNRKVGLVLPAKSLAFTTALPNAKVREKELNHVKWDNNVKQSLRVEK